MKNWACRAERPWLSWKWVLGQAGERWTSANEYVKLVCYFFFFPPLLLFHPTHLIPLQAQKASQVLGKTWSLLLVQGDCNYTGTPFLLTVTLALRKDLWLVLSLVQKEKKKGFRCHLVKSIWELGAVLEWGEHWKWEIVKRWTLTSGMLTLECAYSVNLEFRELFFFSEL